MILDPTNSQHIDFNDWLAQCPVQWFKLDSDDDQRSYQFIIDTSEEDNWLNTHSHTQDYEQWLLNNINIPDWITQVSLQLPSRYASSKTLWLYLSRSLRTTSNTKVCIIQLYLP